MSDLANEPINAADDATGIPAVPEKTGWLEGETRFQQLEEGLVLIDTDQAPPEYKQVHGEVEADITDIGPQRFPSVVTAHFPDRATGEQALAQLQGLNFERDQAIQFFGKESPDAPGDTQQDPGLAPGETAIIVQLDREEQGAEVLRIFEAAGAKHSRQYASETLGTAHRNLTENDPEETMR